MIMAKNYTYRTYKSKQEWLKHRVIGGSQASSILDLNPWQSKLDLFMILTGLKQEKDKDSKYIQYGIEHEPLIRNKAKELFKDQYIIKDPKPYRIFTRKDKPFMTATIDGTIKDKATNQQGILEIKTHEVRNANDYSQWLVKIPDNYYVQVLHYLAILNDYDFVIIIVELRFKDNTTKLIHYRIDRVNVIKDINYLVDKETEFYNGNVLTKIMPGLKYK